MISIDILPDDVLLAIFYFYVDEASEIAHSKESVEEWQSPVHVCQRWRSIVFGSPRRFNLRLGCTPKTPTRDLLNIWPALPLLIWGDDHYYLAESMDNISAVLEHSDRIRYIHLPSSYLENSSATMQVPFPELTVLELYSNGKWMPVLPNSFLGGSALHLQSLTLKGIPFPGLPKLLCLPLTSPSFAFMIFPMPGTFLPR